MTAGPTSTRTSWAAAALEAPRCECERPVLDGDECGYCGREIREPGTLGREFRKAAYDRRLRWARGAGLDPRRDFRGIHGEVGANPELPTLDAALSARVEALAPAQGDPFADVKPRSWRRESADRTAAERFPDRCRCGDGCERRRRVSKRRGTIARRIRCDGSSPRPLRLRSTSTGLARRGAAPLRVRAPCLGRLATGGLSVGAPDVAAQFRHGGLEPSDGVA